MKKKKLLKEIDTLKSNQWSKVSEFNESELQKNLPFPRLEMRLEKLSDNWGVYQWIYGIVYKHFSHAIVESDVKRMIFVPLSMTTGRGGNPILEDGKMNLPFRDGIHILYERDVFNLPAFIICEELNKVTEITDPIHNKEILLKLKRDGKNI